MKESQLRICYCFIYFSRCLLKNKAKVTILKVCMIFFCFIEMEILYAYPALHLLDGVHKKLKST